MEVWRCGGAEVWRCGGVELEVWSTDILYPSTSQVSSNDQLLLLPLRASPRTLPQPRMGYILMT